MERVGFITVESGVDLIVSFAIETEEPGDVKSLTLVRTPKYEVLLDEAERGVFVSHEDFPDDDRETLEAIEFGRHTTVVSRRRKYYFDLRSVRNSEMNQAAKVLRKMNFDGRFKLSIV